MDVVIEEHGQSKQLVRFRAWPRMTTVGVGLIVALSFVSLVDAGVAKWQGAAICGIPAILLALRSLQECAAGMAAAKSALAAMDTRNERVVENILQRIAPTGEELGVPPATVHGLTARGGGRIPGGTGDGAEVDSANAAADTELAPET
jgi:hypothetical protein